MSENKILEDHLTAAAEKCGIPEYMVGGIMRYILAGVEPGDFLESVISNNLKLACAKADHTNINLLPNYVKFFYNWAPPECWGSPEKYTAWIAVGGLSREEKK